MLDLYAQQELESEWNARFDYIAELKAEHAEDPATLASEEEWSWLNSLTTGPAYWPGCECSPQDDWPF